MKIIMGFLLLCFASVAAWAQSNLPAPVTAAIEDARKACAPDKAELKEGFSARKDVNGDGVDDYILNYDKYVCGDSSTYFCGTAGCLVQVFASLRDGSYAKVLDENVRQLAFKTIKGRPAMILDLHGSACGRVGAAPCRKTLYWNGRKFTAR